MFLFNKTIFGPTEKPCSDGKSPIDATEGI